MVADPVPACYRCQHARSPRGRQRLRGAAARRSAARRVRHRQRRRNWCGSWVQAFLLELNAELLEPTHEAHTASLLRCANLLADLSESSAFDQAHEHDPPLRFRQFCESQLECPSHQAAVLVRRSFRVQDHVKRHCRHAPTSSLIDKTAASDRVQPAKIRWRSARRVRERLGRVREHFLRHVLCRRRRVNPAPDKTENVPVVAAYGVGARIHCYMSRPRSDERNKSNATGRRGRGSRQHSVWFDDLYKRELGEGQQRQNRVARLPRPARRRARFVYVVPKVGIEPTRPEGHRILSPARLPVPPLRRGTTIVAALSAV